MPERDERPGDETLARPAVYIPWGPGDDGIRGVNNSVPPWVVSYLWPGIKVFHPDGAAHLGGLLPINQTSTVVVDVANSGTNDAEVQVAVYWSDPTAGFTPPHLRHGPELGPATSVHVASHGLATAPPITLRPTDATPPHFCLIAVVSAAGSPPDLSWNPFADGHYDQHNLDTLEVAPNRPGTFPVYVVNPFRDRTAFVEVSLRAATGAQSRWLEEEYRAPARELHTDALRLLSIGDREADRPRPVLRLELEPGARRLCQALVSTDAMTPGEFAAVEVRTRATPTDATEDDVPAEGSFGTVLFAHR